MGKVLTKLLIASVALLAAASARAEHACDDLGDAGWRTLATLETVNVADSAPFAAGGDWFVNRTTTLLPLCNYINAAGNYSLRSYSLDPEDKTERVMICKGGAAVAPYAGSCPPK